MNRSVLLLLIPMLTLGVFLPHSRVGGSFVEPSGRFLPPHIHLTSDHHHAPGGDHEHHQSGGPSDAEQSETAEFATLSVPFDHDSDAVYFSDSEWTAGRTSVTTRVFPATLVWTTLGPSVCRDSISVCRIDPLPDRYPGLPIYLLIASLRL